METNLADVLYLYDTPKNPKSVLRTALSEKEGPRWTCENCRNFTELEFEILLKSLGDKVEDYYDKEIQRSRRGWCIVEGNVREKIILGCIANGINLQIIQWEGKK